MEAAWPADGDVLRAAPPRFGLEGAAVIAADVFGVRATATPLVSERDQNFRLAADDGRGWVLKVSNSGEREGVVEMETGVVRHVAAVDPTLPVAVARETRDGAFWGTITGLDGGHHFVRLLPVLPGRKGTAIDLSREAIRDLGATSARLGRATRGYFHLMAGRPILWDVKHLPELRLHRERPEDPPPARDPPRGRGAPPAGARRGDRRRRGVAAGRTRRRRVVAAGAESSPGRRGRGAAGAES